MVRLTFDHHYAARQRADRRQKHDPRRSMGSDRSSLTATSRLQKAFVPQTTVEALDEAVLHRFAGRDVVPFDLSVLLPREDRIRRQFCPVACWEWNDAPLRVMAACAASKTAQQAAITGSQVSMVV